MSHLNQRFALGKKIVEVPRFGIYFIFSTLSVLPKIGQELGSPNTVRGDLSQRTETEVLRTPPCPGSIHRLLPYMIVRVM